MASHVVLCLYPDYYQLFILGLTCNSWSVVRHVLAHCTYLVTNTQVYTGVGIHHTLYKMPGLSLLSEENILHGKLSAALCCVVYPISILSYQYCSFPAVAVLLFSTSYYQAQLGR